MFKNISFKTIRALQICTVFTTTMGIQVLFDYPRAAWTGFAVMMIYVGFDAGATMTRTFARFWGMVLGLILSYFLWIVGHIDYRVFFVSIPVIVFFAYYSLGKSYAIPTIFTVTLTAIGTIYYGTGDYYALWFFTDYFICTVIALVICVVFEYYIYHGHNMHRRFYIDLQKEVINRLEELLNLATQTPISKSKWLKVTVKFNKTVIQFNDFVANTERSYRVHDGLLSELEHFSTGLQLAYQNLRRMFILSPGYSNDILNETVGLINNLICLVKLEQSELV